MKNNNKIDYSVIDDEWYKYPRTLREAVNKGSPSYFDPDSPCKHSHIAPRSTSGFRCRACKQIDNLKDRIKTNTGDLWPGSKPVKIKNKTLTADDDSRNTNCIHYGQCCVWAWGKIKGRHTWVCGKDCQYINTNV